MESFKNLIIKLKELIESLFSDLFDGISDGIENEDIGEVAKNTFLLCIVCSLFLILGYMLIIVALHNSVKLVIISFLAASVYSLYQKLAGVVEPEPIHKPTSEDYTAVNKTLKAALTKVAPALGLAPIHSYTDITLDQDDMITEYGKLWRLGYGALKKTAGVNIDTDMCRRVLQAQVKRVLATENPSGFLNTRLPYGGRVESLIQVDEVMQDEAYIYIFVVIASESYFRQKAEWNNRESMLTNSVDTDDEDF